jgi:hypothetical protein
MCNISQQLLKSTIIAKFTGGDITSIMNTIMQVEEKNDGQWIEKNEDSCCCSTTTSTTATANEIQTTTTTTMMMMMEGGTRQLLDLSIWLISTLKRRKKMMNKHKLRKRRKKLRLKTRK